ncbi:MAG: saccharopine dehydrogenase family protein [Longimicrobiaceae bacterium]
MKTLVLGAGQQGSACAYDLLTRSGHEVILADAGAGEPAPFLRPYLDGRLRLETVDATDSFELRRVMEGVTATMSALPYYLNLDAAVAAIDAGSHFCDLGGNTEIVLKQKELDGRARDAGVSVIPDSGLAPGMVNILAEDGIRSFERVRSVRIKVGGLPQYPEPPLDYQVVYSLEGVLDYYHTLSWILRGGRLMQVEALSGVEQVDFDEVGKLEAFHTAGGLSTMAERYQGKIETMEYKTLRYPGHARVVEAIRELGLIDPEPIRVGDQRVVPRDVFIACAEPRLRKHPAESPDLVVLRVEVRGEKDGAEEAVRYELVDRYDPETGITAMMRSTGFSLSITGLLQLAGEIEPGVRTPDEAVPAGPYLEALGERGVEVLKSNSAAVPG